MIASSFVLASGCRLLAARNFANFCASQPGSGVRDPDPVLSDPGFWILRFKDSGIRAIRDE